MKEFILSNWKEIIVIFCFFLELVLSIIAVFKKAKKDNSLYADILCSLPNIISEVEKLIGRGNGEKKMMAVLDTIDKLFVKETGKVMTNSDAKFFRNEVEKILLTPQKKKET